MSRPPNIKAKRPLGLANSVVIVLLGILACCLIAVSFIMWRHTLHSPSVVVVSICQPTSSGMHRIRADFGIEFDVSESVFAVQANLRDMPPGRLYVVTLKNSNYKMIIWHDDEFFDELKSGFPVLSKRVEEREIHSANGHNVGQDSWGYLRTGEKWRYVSFRTGDAVGYQPVPARQAALFDEVIGSACTTTR